MACRWFVLALGISLAACGGGGSGGSKDGGGSDGSDGAAQTRTLTVVTTGTGTGTIASQPAGIDCGTTCSANYSQGTIITLTATAASGSVFEGWSGACTGTDTCTVTLSDNKNVAASFTLQGPATLTVNQTAGGTITGTGLTCNGSVCTGSYPFGTTVALTASPDGSSSFNAWADDCTGTTGNVCNIVVAGPRTVSATWSTVGVGLTTSVSGGTLKCAAGGATATQCLSSYPLGTVLTVTASPDATHVSGGWGGDCSGSTNTPCVLTMTAAKTVSATFGNGSSDLILMANGGSIKCSTGGGAPITCTTNYPLGTVVVLTATPDPSHIAGAWTGDCTGSTTNQCTVTMWVSHTATATFAPGPNGLTVAVTGGTVQCAAGGPLGQCQSSYPSGTVVSIVGTPGQFHSAGTWGGDCSGPTTTPCMVTINQGRSVTATFTPGPVPISVSASNGTVQCAVGAGPAGACATTYTFGTVVTLTGAPNPNFNAGTWGGDCSGPTSDACMVTMSQSRSVTATFQPNAVGLTVTPTNGTIQCSVAGGPGPCALTYGYGTSITLTASPSAGFVAGTWGGDCAGPTTNPCSFTMLSPKNVTATFLPANEPLTISPPPSGGSILCNGVACAATYPTNSVITLTGVPDPTHTTGSWGGDCGGPTTTPCMLTMNMPHTVTATFALMPVGLTVNVGNGGGVTCTVAGITGSCASTYPSGTMVTLTATPDPNHMAGSWSNACNGTDASDCMVTLNTAKTVGASFTPVQETLTVSASGGTITCSPGGTGNSCNASYAWGTTVTFTGMASPTNQVGTWGGDCNGSTSNTCVILFDGPKNVSASFPIKTVGLTLNPNGGTFMCSTGGNPATTCATSYPINTVVTITGTPDSGLPGHWANDCGNGTTAVACMVTLATAKTATANFGEGLTVANTGSGSFSCKVGNTTVTCNGAFDFGTTVVITAAPTFTSSSHNHITSWSNDCAASGTNATCSLNMTAGRSTTIAFDVDLVTLTVTIAGAGSGSTSDGASFGCTTGSCSHDYPYNTTTITLTPTAAVGSSFMGWTNGGAGCNGTGNCVLSNFKNALTVTATFKTP